METEELESLIMGLHTDYSTILRDEKNLLGHMDEDDKNHGCQVSKVELLAEIVSDLDSLV